MGTLLERYAVKPGHVEAWEPLLAEQVALRTAAGFRVRRLFLETDAEPKLTCLLEHDDPGGALSLQALERTGAHLDLRDRMAPHVFRNRVVRPVEPWVVTDATPESIVGTAVDGVPRERIAIMRRYDVVTGWNGFDEVGWDDFEAIWRRILPVREKYGFRCLFAVADRAHDLFTWAFDLDGDWAGFGAAQRDYYRDPERVELRRVFDHMADYSIHPARQILVPEATPMNSPTPATGPAGAAQGTDTFASFRAPNTDRSVRVARGKALRTATPHEALGTFALADDRPDVVELITRTHQGRLPELFGVRVARMAASPFGFLRGSASLMAHDVAHLPSTGVMTTVCGDAHIGNIGFYRSPEGNQVIDLNDFDEAHTGAWEWDLRRLTASIHVLGRDNGHDEDACREAVMSCVRTYRDQVSFLSKQPLLWRAFNHLDVDSLEQSATDEGLRDEIRRQATAARRRTDDRKLPKVAGGSTSASHIVDAPPLITHPSAAEHEALAQGLDAYLPTLTPQWRRIVGGYSLVDIAHKVVGVGSVGMRSWVALLVGSREDDVLFLQLKQAQRSVLAPYVHGDRVWHAHQGQRVVEYQQQLQTVSDPLLGWTTVGEHQYYVRQWRNMKGGVPLDAMGADALVDYAGITGTLLAKGHARTSGASVISGYLGKKESAPQAFAAWARAAADQNERDHARLVAAVEAGRLPHQPA